MQALLSMMDTLAGAVSSVQQLILLPTGAARQIAATLSAVVGKAKDIAASFEALPYAEQHRDAQRADGFGSTTTRSEALTKSGSAGIVDNTGAANISGIQVYDRADYAHRVKRAARAVWSAAILRRDQILDSLESDLRAIYTAREGDDLRDVAQNICGDSDEWRKIMMFNGLTSTLLVAGQIVLIPTASAEGTCASILP